MAPVTQTRRSQEISFPSVGTTPELVAEATRYFKKDLGLDVNTIDGARIEFPDGWGLIRASNTGPELVMRCEADTKKRMNEIKTQSRTAIKIQMVVAWTIMIVFIALIIVANIAART